jgi:predicted GIY-YIG superfamily endonuclease
MNQEFATRVDRVKALYERLRSSPVLPLEPKSLPSEAGIYVFLEQDAAVHVGRTRNLKQRIRGHLTNSHYSASFAFKETRRAMNLVKASYTKAGSRTALMADEVFQKSFVDQISRIRGMQLQFIRLDDPIDQYLLELYAALELGTSLSEFDTH